MGSCVHFEGTKGVRVHEGWQAGRDTPAQLAPPITPVSHITLAGGAHLKKSLVDAYIILALTLALSGALRQCTAGGSSSK